ncbi:uncharacterized protein LOC106131411 [Amyelois transitella]|uniref:uncharacterized protein LOC106131411 n=1 Tax=Amyelois transitella TaxID=680683 RepID=UPI00298FEC5C|nr:uncharacterized protein LOC106131411 [Amyelois transitella]
MECESVDSKKLYKVFDASKRKRARKKREGQDDSNSVATDDTASGCQANCRSASAKTSLQHVPTVQTISMNKDSHKRLKSHKLKPLVFSVCKSGIGSDADLKDRDRDRDSSPAVSPSPTEAHHKRSSTDTRRRDDMSLALKAGLISPSTSISPRQGGLDSLVPDQDSIIYAYLEDALKKEKKKERQSRRHDDYRSCQRHQSATHRHRHHHHHRRRCEEVNSRDRDKSKDLSTVPLLNQAILFETFAKLCAQFNEKSAAPYPNQVKRSLSHKSLQCEVLSKHNYQDVDQRPTRLPNRTEEQSRDNVSRIRSQENFHGRSQERVPMNSRPDRIEKQEKCGYPPYEKDPRYVSKLDLTSSRIRTVDDRTYQEYSQNHIPEGTCHDQYRTRPPQEYRDYREYEKDRRNYEDKRYLDQRTSRSFDVRDHRDGYPDDEKWRRTARSDNVKEKRYDPRDRRYDERYKYYYEDKVDRERYNMPQRDSRRSRRNLERFERNSIASREDDYKDRDRYSEKERDSGLSVADGENSTVSGKSNYLRTMKQEIAEQREAMDKMMKLWKELMRCFKGMTPQTQGQDRAVHENAANVRDSAAAQLRLWRECMRRYETVARDVGDTDARLMEEINKQRSEMAEMATMWQECLQRYREMSTDFNSLKQQLTPPEPVRLPAAPVACAEGEGHVPPAAPYRLPPTYPPQMPPVSGYGSPLRHNASAPPAWWWTDARPSPRRRSSPDSRGSRDRDRERRHRQKNRDDTRYKDKPSKPSAARSEHRHRKR